MVKLKSILIKGFKEANREVSVLFSEEPVTVLYGANGSGKTTFLKILHAIFTKNEAHLRAENIKEIQIHYWNHSKIEKNVLIQVKGKKIDWGEGIQDLTAQTSILFGVNRGLISGTTDIHQIALLMDEHLKQIRNDNALKSHEGKYENELYFLIAKLKLMTEHKSIFNLDKTHLEVDSISIYEIESAIIKQFRVGQRITSEQVKNAFFNTISNAVDIEMEQSNYKDKLPDDFYQRIADKRTILIELVNQLDKSSLQIKLAAFLKKNTEIKNSKIFRALLINILEAVEEINIELQSISQLIEIFNNHLYRHKKLVVTEEKAYITLEDFQTHPLEALSSGERHLLSFLTLFLILGRTRNFFLIDEPDISLNMKWQRELMPLLSKLCPQAQIIVATHSPSIAHKKATYLSELL